MSIGEVVAFLREGILETLKLASPILLSALAIGLIVAILQAATSIQEQTLTFVPKLFVILGALALLGALMFTSLRDYTIRLFQQIPDMAR
jgi:flagellar biosynthesis protein FliQ